MYKTLWVISSIGLVSSSLPLMVEAASNKTNPDKNVLTSHKVSAVELSLGGSYTQLKDYKGEGFNISAKVYLLEDMETKKIPLNIYGKISYQTSVDKDNHRQSYFDETELVLGAEYYCCQQSKLFLELGDIKQNFEQDNAKLWQDYGYVYRAGIDAEFEVISMNIALEHRDSVKSDTGYRASLTTKNKLFSISYTDVGDYQSLMFNLNKHF